jgi:hypothetical protein
MKFFKYSLLIASFLYLVGFSFFVALFYFWTELWVSLLLFGTVLAMWTIWLRQVIKVYTGDDVLTNKHIVVMLVGLVVISFGLTTLLSLL